MIVYLARAIQAFVMYCVNGTSRSSLLIESIDSMINEELGRHRGREGKTECSLCGDECENVSHVLWECSAYSSTRACFITKLQELLEDEYKDFESLDKVEKSSYVLGSELWESKFDGLLSLVKEYIIDVWEIRKQII